VYVQGSDPVARAILDARTRALLLPLFAGRLRYEGNESPGLQVEVTVVSGELRVVFRPLFVETLHRQLRDVLGALRLVAESLRTPADVPGRIALNNQSEPEWKVRVANLRCLAETFANARATQEALRAAAQDERLEVQLAAARALPANEGRALLVDIASREWADDACAAEAVGALGDGFPAEKALATLTHALRSRRISTASGCLARLGNTRNERFVEPLGKVLAVEKGPLALAAARALGALGATSAEAPLLEALVRREPDLEVAVVEALGQAGSAGAVLTLKDLQERKDTDRQLRSAARQAVARIQSRLVGASPGQLSLASGEAGQLSLADEDPKGRLSLPEPPPAE
jgi:hypothetical protein